jgi:glycosyltransferase involved in cell wall biosynthesis
MGIQARFLLAGEPDQRSSGSISPSQLAQWRIDGNVELLGFRKDVRELIQNSNVIVHPSTYGEGIPKILIEAAACGRAIITTDHPGCREAVLDGQTGLLTVPKDVDALVAAIVKLVSSPSLRHKFGAKGRELAERDFSVDSIVAQHLQVYEAIA